MESVGLTRRIADHVVAHLSPATFDGLIHLTHGRLQPLRVQLEVMDERLHAGDDLVFRRRHDLAIVDSPRTFGESVKRLFHDTQALCHLLNSHPETVVHVAVSAYHHLEVKVLVAAVRHRFSHVIRDAGAAKGRAGASHVDRDVGREHADSLRALDPDLILGEELVVLLQTLREVADEFANHRLELRSEILSQPADADETRHHPDTRQIFFDVQDLLTLTEGIHEHAHRAQVQPVGPDPDEVTRDAFELGEQDADPFDALRHLDPQQLLDRQHVRQLIHHVVEVTHPVAERNDLLVLETFAGLLDACVEVSDVRLHVEYSLALQFHQHAQHSVRGRMLRPQVEDHRVFARLDGHYCVSNTLSVLGRGKAISDWR